MKFTRDQYSLKPPSVHGWMRKHYCPVLEDLLSFEKVQPIVENKWKRNSYSIQLIDFSYSVGVETCTITSASVRRAIKALQGSYEEGVRFKIYFKDPDVPSRLPGYSTAFNLDEAYLVPYLFRAVRDANDPLSRSDIFLRHDHREKAERLGLIERGFLEKSKY